MLPPPEMPFCWPDRDKKRAGSRAGESEIEENQPRAAGFFIGRKKLQKSYR
jgi:hypothetical protein